MYTIRIGDRVPAVERIEAIRKDKGKPETLREILKKKASKS